MLNRLMHQPFTVLVICLGILFSSLIIEGSLFQLWGMHKDLSELRNKISSVKGENQHLEQKIQNVQRLENLELEVRDQLDLVEKGDLIFVFSEE